MVVRYSINEFKKILKDYYKDKYNKNVIVEYNVNKAYSFEGEYYYDEITIFIKYKTKVNLLGYEKETEEFECIYGGNSYKVQGIVSELMSEEYYLSSLYLEQNSVLVGYQKKQSQIQRKLR